MIIQRPSDHFNLLGFSDCGIRYASSMPFTLNPYALAQTSGFVICREVVEQKTSAVKEKRGQL
jgi:hypothetical protein